MSTVFEALEIEPRRREASRRVGKADMATLVSIVGCVSGIRKRDERIMRRDVLSSVIGRRSVGGGKGKRQ